jgi:hypothetical protein
VDLECYKVRTTYNHFWFTKGTLSRSEWDVLATAGRKIAKACEDFGTFAVAGGTSNPRIEIGPVVPFAHCEFKLVPEPMAFVGCRTNRDVYDLPVTMTLLAAKRLYPGWIKLTSDGVWAEWEDARLWCREVLGYKDADFAAAKQDFDELLDPDDRNMLSVP